MGTPVRNRTKLFDQPSETFRFDINLFHMSKYLFGGFWIRTFAYLFDYFIIQLLTSILLNLTVFRLLGLGVSEVWWVEFLRLIVFLAYFAASTYFFKGQTPGKVLFNLRVYSMKETSLPGKTILLREIPGRVVFYYFPIIAVMLVFTLRRQHVVDMLMDTVVVNENMVKEFSPYLNEK